MEEKEGVTMTFKEDIKSLSQEIETEALQFKTLNKIGEDTLFAAAKCDIETMLMHYGDFISELESVSKKVQRCFGGLETYNVMILTNALNNDIKNIMKKDCGCSIKKSIKPKEATEAK